MHATAHPASTGNSPPDALLQKAILMVCEKPNILILDDSPATTSTLVRMLASDFRVQRVPDGQHVLDVARRADPIPDLILLDVTSPPRTAFELCRQLKADEMTQAVPVVLITEREDHGDEERGLRLGAAACIARPYRLDVAKARIRQQVRVKVNNDLLERYAQQDSLTGLANRRRFDLALDIEWRRCLRERQPLSLLLLDVDCFKEFNDNYGHRAGDQCLRRIAQELERQVTRPGDLLARHVGEQFAVLLPGTDLAGARNLGEKLRTAITQLNIPHQRRDGLRRITLSAGCTSALPGPDLNRHQMREIADDQLRAAKKAGRDCVLALQTI